MIDRAAVARIASGLKRASDFRFFFENIESVDWIAPLAEEGFFSDPPGVRTVDSVSTYPPWPPSAFLSRVAAEAPEDVARVIHAMPETDNPIVHADLIRAMAAMPPEWSLPLVGRAAGWIDGDTWWGFNDPAFALVEVLFAGGYSDEAIEVALAVLAIPRDEQSADRFVEGARRGDEWSLQKGLETLLQMVPDTAVVDLVRRLSDGLAFALESERGESSERIWSDSSHIWHSAIETHEQSRHYDRKAWLIDAIRDLSIRAGQSDPSELPAMVARMHDRHWAVFIRLGMHLCRVFPDVLGGRARASIADLDSFESREIRHEYYWLVHDILGRPESSQAQLEYLALVDAGPPEWLIERYDVDGLREERIGSWTRDRLHPIRNELTGTWAERYAELIAAYGEPEHADFLSYIGPVRSMGSEAPLSRGALGALPTRDLIVFLDEWSPSGDFGDASIEGLGRAIASVVALSPGRFAENAMRFRLDEPTYVRSIIDGFNTAVQEDHHFDWSPVLDLSAWVLDQEDQEEGRSDWSQDPDWSWARKSVAGLIGSGLESPSDPIPQELAAAVFRIIAEIAWDSQPSPEYEQQYGGTNMDPVSLSLNTIRPYALHDAVRLLQWSEETYDSDGLVSSVLDLMDWHLDIVQDPSLAVRSVFGWGLGTLLNASPVWVDERIDQIFPADESLDEYRQAAFDAFLMRWQPSRQMFDLLASQYETAIERLSSSTDEEESNSRDDSGERLANHLLSYFWWEYFELDGDDLLSLFMQNASDQLRASLIHHIGRILEHSDDVPPGIIERTMELWESRLASAQANDHEAAKEMGALVWWFRVDDFDTRWLFEQLLHAADYVTWIDAPIRVTGRLLENVSEQPVLTLKALRVLIAKDQWRHIAVTQSDAVREILTIAMESGAAARQEARALIDWLAAGGQDQYRDLAAELASDT